MSSVHFRRPPLELRGPSIADHRAVRAWSGLPAAPAAPVAVEVWREKNPTSIYRLVFVDLPAVFAKRCDAAAGEIERACHEDILPRLPLSSPRHHGSLRDADGSWWLFAEDVGREVFTVQDPEQRRLAGRWVGALHRHGARIPAAARLPRAGLERFEGHLRSAHEHIWTNLENPALTGGDRAMLAAILRLAERVGSRWGDYERAFEGVPATLVHGDFQPKNIRIHRNGAAPTFYVFDWELAGWGLPAVDLAPANGHDLVIQVDPETYLDEVRGEWPHLDAAAIEKQVALGHVLRRLAAIDWASHSLHFERADYLSDPVESLRSIHGSLTRAVEGAEEWLR